jgi:hypothetical protein
LFERPREGGMNHKSNIRVLVMGRSVGSCKLGAIGVSDMSMGL